MEKLECYAVFEGGGVKGIAFAGALEAADQAGIEFVGYAGASAGALVGFLACLGYSGHGIYRAIRAIDFSKFTRGDIEEHTSHVKRVISDIKEIKRVNPNRGFIAKASYYAKIKSRIPVITIVKDLWAIYIKLDRDKGLYSKDMLIHTLVNLAQTKINLSKYVDSDGKYYRSVTFRDFYTYTKKDFRVIATDVLTGRVIEFSHLKTPDACVIQIVAASSAYPMIFEPTEYNGMYLVDGGLSCNLPSYIFHDSQHKRLPTYAFDLMSDQDSYNGLSKYDIFSHLKRLIHSSLDASNNIISTVAGGIAVPIRVPTDIDTMNMNISTKDAKLLYRSGYKSSKRFFKKHDLTYIYTKANSKHHIATLLYGRCEGLLNLFFNYIEKPTSTTLKMWLYTTIDSTDKELVSFAKRGVVFLSVNKIVNKVSSSAYRVPFAFTYNKIKDYVFPLSINGRSNKDNDCVKTWMTGIPSISFKGNNTRICFPIHRFDSKNVMAVFCVSIDQSINACKWVNYRSSSNTVSIDISKKFGKMLYDYTLIVRNAMYGHQVYFNELNQSGGLNVYHK